MDAYDGDGDVRGFAESVADLPQTGDLLLILLGLLLLVLLPLLLFLLCVRAIFDIERMIIMTLLDFRL